MNILSRTIVAGTLILLCCQALVAGDKGPDPGYRSVEEIHLLGSLTVRHYALPNGLQVAIVRDSTTPIFTYQTWYRTGSADEPAGHQGLAHLFEHMMFRETSNHPMGEFRELYTRNGGRGLNAYTGRDQTVYFYTFPNNKLDLAADLESDRMVHLVIDSAMFATEKGAVLTEKNRGLDDPRRFLWENVYTLAYTRHTYRYSGIGEVETIKNFTVEEAKAFYRNFYAPNNALVVVVGDVVPEDVMNTITEHYASYTPSTIKKREVTEEPPQMEDRSSTVTHPRATQKMMATVWHIPNMLHPDYPALAMVGKLLTSGNTAILNERLLNRAKVTSLFADVYVSKDNGTFEFFVQLPDSGSFEEVRATFQTSLQELAHGAISEDQLVIVKNTMLTDLYRSATNPSSLAGLLGEGFIYAGDLGFQIKAATAIEQVKKEDIGRVIRTYILGGKSTTVKLLPEKKS